MANRTKLALLASPVLISACVQDVNPEWETYFSTSDNKNNIEWLNHVVADNNDDLILNPTLRRPNRMTRLLMLLLIIMAIFMHWARRLKPSMGMRNFLLLLLKPIRMVI